MKFVCGKESTVWDVFFVKCHHNFCIHLSFKIEWTELIGRKWNAKIKIQIFETIFCHWVQCNLISFDFSFTAQKKEIELICAQKNLPNVYLNWECNGSWHWMVLPEIAHCAFSCAAISLLISGLDFMITLIFVFSCFSSVFSMFLIPFEQWKIMLNVVSLFINAQNKKKYTDKNALLRFSSR